jgi:integrase
MLARYGDAIVHVPGTTRILRIKQTKSKRIRRIPLPAEIVSKLYEYLADQNRLRQELSLSAVGLHDWMFPKPGEPDQLWSPSAFTSCYRAFLRRRELKAAKFHGLRHAYGSQLIRDGFDIKTVQFLMGHSRASTTLDVYSHLLDQPGEEVAQRIQSRIERARNRKVGGGPVGTD